MMYVYGICVYVYLYKNLRSNPRLTGVPSGLNSLAHSNPQLVGVSSKLNSLEHTPQLVGVSSKLNSLEHTASAFTGPALSAGHEGFPWRRLLKKASSKKLLFRAPS